nr:PREDICTED: uncharacterized protein LOC103546611 [Equus przewalskii]
MTEVTREIAWNYEGFEGSGSNSASTGPQADRSHTPLRTAISKSAACLRGPPPSDVWVTSTHARVEGLHLPGGSAPRRGTALVAATTLPSKTLREALVERRVYNHWPSVCRQLRGDWLRRPSVTAESNKYRGLLVQEGNFEQAEKSLWGGAVLILETRLELGESLPVCPCLLWAQRTEYTLASAVNARKDMSACPGDAEPWRMSWSEALSPPWLKRLKSGPG